MFRTVLDYACFGGKAHTVQNLLINMQAGQAKDDLDRALHCAAFAGSMLCVDQLLGVILRLELKQLTILFSTAPT